MTLSGHFRGIFGVFLCGYACAMIGTHTVSGEDVGEPRGAAAHGTSWAACAPKQSGGEGDALYLWRLCL